MTTAIRNGVTGFRYGVTFFRYGVGALLIGVIAGCSPASDTPAQAQGNAVQKESIPVQKEGGLTQDKKIPTQKAERAESGYQRYLQDVSRLHLAPGYENLSEKARSLNQVVDLSCKVDNGSSVNWQGAQTQWRETMQAWQGIKWMQLGPVNLKSRHQRLQYWPDGNDAVGRGLGKLLLQTPAPDVTRLSQINVGAQGLPALERLIFSHAGELPGDQAHQCAVAKVIADNIQQISIQMDQEWKDYSQTLIQGKEEFNGVKDATEELISNWLAQLIVLIDNRLTYPLSVGSPGIPALAESPYSDVSMLSIRANLRSFKAALTAGNGYGLDDMLADRGQTELASQIVAELDKSITMADALPDAFSQGLADPQSWKQMQTLVTQLKVFQKLMVEGVVMQLQLNIGFNALDGD